MLLTTLYVLAGVCLYAAIHHLWIARNLSDRTHWLFALLCLTVTSYVLVKAGAYRAATATELVTLRRWEVSLGIVTIGLLPWFVVAYAGLRWRLLPTVLSVLLALFFIANLVLPYGVTFIGMPTLVHFTLPWGEQVVDLRVHQRSFLFNAGWLVILFCFTFSGYVCLRLYRQAKSRKALALALALGTFLVSVLFNQAVNFGWINFTHTAEFGFVALVLLMSAALGGELHRSMEARTASEAALRASTVLQRAILDNAGHAIISTTVDGRITSFNRAAERMLGYRAEEMIDRATLAVIHDPVEVGARAREFSAALGGDIESGFEVLVAKARRGLPNEHEWTYLRKDGSRFPVLLTVTALRDQVGEISGFLGLAIDISERKRARDDLQRSEERLRTVFEASPATINISRLDNGRILYVNRAWEAATGWPRASAVGRTAKDLQLWPDVAQREALRERVRQTDSVHDVEWQRRARSGEVHTVLGSITRIEIDGAECALTFTQDITKRKQAETELARYREHLEELVEARTNALEATNHELEAFSYSVSHDLRAPLRSINGFSQALAEEYAEKLDTTAMDYLNRVCQGALRMGALIDDLLKLSRVTRQDLRCQNVNLSALAAEIAAELRAREPGRVVDWQLAPHVSVSGDPHLLRIVMDNLLGNAWKYTSRMAHARIEFGVRNDGGNVVYFVRDNGAGFDMQYADRLFGAFQRLHKVEDFPGNGIGLATVKRIVVRHGGRIWAESQPGLGATFYFTLSRTEESGPRGDDAV
jgi:PAS domain S-box-containing protein